MEGWSRHDGRAIALPLENVDTDQLIPARFMSAPRREGYGGYLLHDMRRLPDGSLDPGFPLNRSDTASVLVARRNFGCGSSREAAVYALVDAGFSAVLAPSFGDIFASNAVNNGLLPAILPEDDVEALIGALNGTTKPCAIDLKEGVIKLEQHLLRFDLDPTWRTKLINGWDDIDLTRADADKITAFRKARQDQFRWAWPSLPDRSGT